MWLSEKKFKQSVLIVCYCLLHGVLLLQGDTAGLRQLGWVNFDFGCFTVCLILLGQMRERQNLQGSWARWVELPSQSKLNQDPRPVVSPCSPSKKVLLNGMLQGLQRVPVRVVKPEVVLSARQTPAELDHVWYWLWPERCICLWIKTLEGSVIRNCFK